MHAKFLNTRFGILYSLVAAVVALPSTSSQVSAGEEAFIVLPGPNTPLQRTARPRGRFHRTIGDG